MCLHKCSRFPIQLYKCNVRTCTILKYDVYINDIMIIWNIFLIYYVYTNTYNSKLVKSNFKAGFYWMKIKNN